jgi:hypothetical protein
MKEFRSNRLRVWENINRTMQEFKVLLLGYRSYTALLTQSGTDAPVATVLENTIGEITFTRDYLPGEYGFETANGFPLDKTFIPGFGRLFLQSKNYSPIVSGGASGDPEILGYYTLYLYPDDNTIYTTFIDLDGNFVDLSYFNAEIPIEIRVYN